MGEWAANAAFLETKRGVQCPLAAEFCNCSPTDPGVRALPRAFSIPDALVLKPVISSNLFSFEEYHLGSMRVQITSIYCDCWKSQRRVGVRRNAEMSCEALKPRLQPTRTPGKPAWGPVTDLDAE